jgi:hypothetical protein
VTERARRATCRWPVLLLTWLCAGHGAAAEPWSAEKFQVVAREPTEDEIALVAEEPGMLERFFSGPGGPGGLDVHGPQPPGTGTIVGWLNDAGGAYRRSSHAPPALGPIVESGAGRRYRVYVFPFAGSRTRDTHAYAAGTYESNTCMENNKIPWLAINHDLAAAAPPRQMFWTITHEMMHAIMFGDRVLDDCNSNPFEVSEGIPDGASLYLVNHKFSGFSGGIAYKSSHVGLRSYRLPFFFFTDVPSSQKTWLELVTGYATSSFWYFVTERFGGLKVLPHFLDKPVREGADHVDMYRWLEERLQSLPGIQSIVPASPDRPVTGTGAKEPPGMYEVYPAFISEFASYGGSRYFKFNDRHFRGVEQARTGWLKRSLGGCEEVTLNPQNKHDKVTLGILENAAKCVRVKYRGFAGNITSKMEILSDRLGQLEQLHLGWAWKIGPEKEENCYLKRKEKNGFSYCPTWRWTRGRQQWCPTTRLRSPFPRPWVTGSPPNPLTRYPYRERKALPSSDPATSAGRNCMACRPIRRSRRPVSRGSLSTSTRPTETRAPGPNPVVIPWYCTRSSTARPARCSASSPGGTRTARTWLAPTCAPKAPADPWGASSSPTRMPSKSKSRPTCAGRTQTSSDNVRAAARWSTISRAR